MNPPGCGDHPQLKPSTILTGTAKEGSVGPPIGLIDIGISDKAYLFRVSLPGIRKDECKVRCNIQRDGTVNIKGIATPDGGILKGSSSTFQMRIQQLCPNGPFGISFKLPGPVDPRLFTPSFRADGVLEGVVMKCRVASTPVDGWFPPQ